MKFSIRFPVRNTVRIPRPWPIQKGNRVYSLETTDDGLLKSVGVTYLKLPIESAPSFQRNPSGDVKATIKFGTDGHSLFAERDVRSWQALVSAYLLVEIDFDSPRAEFIAESEDERAKIGVSSFQTQLEERTHRVAEYTLLGRAFLALDDGYDLIEVTSFYRQAATALFAERSIDAYNQFYLFLETQFCGGHTRTNKAIDQLLNSSAFVSALDETAEECRTGNKKAPRSFKSLVTEPYDRRALVREIVELRGNLRHHTLTSPRRWDPNKQNEFQAEAQFLGAICLDVVFPMTTGKLWQPELEQEYSKLAEEMHMTTEVHVTLTIRHDDRVEDVGLNITVPEPDVTPHMAKFILLKAIEILETRNPAAELFAIRAWTKAPRAELFRYDLGPTIARQ